jgi:hypothetical protein
MQPIVRVPLDKLPVFEALMQALNIPSKKPNQLMSLLIDLANTPQGGEWLRDRVSPKPGEGLAWGPKTPEIV